VAGSGAYVVVIPVKPPGVGKSRLVGIDGTDRRLLAAAFATDTVRACLETPGVARVLVTTDDAHFATGLGELGADTCPDGAAGLNEALREAVAVAARRWPALRPVALCADLPALRPADLAAALAEIARHEDSACFVTDVDGTGTTLYAAPYDAFAPRFGTGSAAAHAAAGALPIRGELPSLRRDVDDVDGLREAAGIGLGTATRALVGALAPSVSEKHAGPPS
jgi:2-phospho-L-lactate guanylyltransferase